MRMLRSQTSNSITNNRLQANKPSLETSTKCSRLSWKRMRTARSSRRSSSSSRSSDRASQNPISAGLCIQAAILLILMPFHKLIRIEPNISCNSLARPKLMTTLPGLPRFLENLAPRWKRRACMLIPEPIRFYTQESTSTLRCGSREESKQHYTFKG